MSPKSENVKSLVGQLFLVGFDGYTVPASFKASIQEWSVGGVLYLKRNCQSPKQLVELANELQFVCRNKSAPPLFISIDHEGGIVNRLAAPFTKFPGMDAVGKLGSPKVGFEIGVALAKELKAVGVNINYAPVVDVLTNPTNPVMKGRTFASDPETCAKLGSAVCRGIQKMNVIAVAKHFPGHGDTTEDSHFALPKVNKSLEELEHTELMPFRRLIRSRIEAVMTAHILNPALDAEYPATLSKKTLDILRNQLRFSKLVFSDDLEMKAIADHYGEEEAAVLAVAAGCDVLIYKGDQGFPVKAAEAIVKAVESGRIPPVQLETAVKRILAAKQAYCQANAPLGYHDLEKHVGCAEHIALADAVQRGEIPKHIDEAAGF